MKVHKIMILQTQESGFFFGKKASCRKKHLWNKHFPNVKNKKEMRFNNHECKLQVLKCKCLIEKAKESVE